MACWTRGGQTLPMKTWRIRLVTADGGPISPGRALGRYLLGWLAFLPPLALHPLVGLGVPATLVATAAWCALWIASAWFDPLGRQPHDRLARTRIVAVTR
ncbi:MAG: hypothetical protein GAK40_00076 [Burkholderia plantarii]|nr:MAG: hypothetical protein GAK40_00076 [Burkholderia plantarii]